MKTNKRQDEQLKLMKQGLSYRFNHFLYKKQTVCERKLLKINRLSFRSKKRDKLFKSLFGKYGSNNVIKSNFQCNFGFNIFIGNACYINHNVTILDSYEVIIGNNVFIGPNVVISPVTHNKIASKRRDLIIKKVVIEDDVWIGAGAIILPGVTIHRGAIIGAGAVVLDNVESNVISVGVPAKPKNVIKQ